MGVSEDDFADFYAEHRDAVYRAVVLVTRNPDAAQDSVAEAFTRCLARWNEVSEHPNPVAWVTRTAINHFISGWRIWRRELPSLPALAAVPDEARSLDPFLLRQLWRLPRRQREVVAHRVLLDMDEQHTADALGMAPGTVGAHLSRALGSLRFALAGTDYEEASR